MNLYTVSPYLRALPPDPVREDLAWMDRALCPEVDPELFFIEKGGSTAPAKRVCQSCEVRAECLEFALDHEYVAVYGVWGGMSERERRRLKHERSANQDQQAQRIAS